jgi:hypothetical protein
MVIRRTAELEVRATTVHLKPPLSSGRKGDSLEVNLVLARELGAPTGQDPLCWYLVTREPIETREQVQRVIEHYEARWMIEEFHMGLKTGCACEQRQLERIHGLRNFLALATPMAVRMLQLRDAVRDCCACGDAASHDGQGQLRPRPDARARQPRGVRESKRRPRPRMANALAWLRASEDGCPGLRHSRTCGSAPRAASQ